MIPKSKTENRIKQNLEGDFKLSAEDVKKVDSLDTTCPRISMKIDRLNNTSSDKRGFDPGDFAI